MNSEFRARLSILDYLGSFAVKMPNSFALGLIFALPVFLVTLNSTWIFNPLGYIDPWYYVGYGYHYNEPDFFNLYYKISRLPWVLCEYFARKAFDPLTAHYVLQFGCLWLTSAAFYFSALRLYGPIPAFISSALLSVFPFFHASGGADYHNTLAGPLYALSFLILTISSSRSCRWPWFILFGVIYGLTIHTNIVFINLSLVLFIHFWIISRKEDRKVRYFIEFAVTAAIGFIFATLVLGAINAAYGRDFLFFRHVFRLASSFVMDPSQQKVWWKPWHTMWFLHCYYLGPFLATGICSILVIARSLMRYRHNWSDSALLKLSAHVQYVIILFVWFMWQTIGHTALDWYYFAYPLIIPLCLALAAHIAEYDEASRLWYLLSIVILTSLSFALPLTFNSNLVVRFHNIQLPAILRTTLIWIIPLLIVFFFSRLRITLLIVIVLFGYANAVSTDKLSSYIPSSCKSGLDGYMVIVEAHKRLAARTKPDQVYIWFDDLEKFKLGDSCGGETSAANFGHSLISTGFGYIQDAPPLKPILEIDEKHLNRIVASRNPVIALVTGNPDNARWLCDRFAHLNFRIEVRSVDVITYGALSIPLYILDRSEQ